MNLIEAIAEYNVLIREWCEKLTSERTKKEQVKKISGQLPWRDRFVFRLVRWFPPMKRYYPGSAQCRQLK